jgi:hypothetical protein
MPEVLFLDFEAFQHGAEDYRVKELCVLDVKKPLKPLSFVYKQTIPWDLLTPQQRRTYSYEEFNFHQLSWEEGNSLYCAQCLLLAIKEAFPLATQKDTICYVLGQQKAKFMQNELPLLNIVEYKNKLSDLPCILSHYSCTYRDHSVNHCAVLKCYQMYMHNKLLS